MANTRGFLSCVSELSKTTTTTTGVIITAAGPRTACGQGTRETQRGQEKANIPTRLAPTLTHRQRVPEELSALFIAWSPHSCEFLPRRARIRGWKALRSGSAGVLR